MEIAVDELESWIVTPPAPAGEFSATVHAVIVPGARMFEAQVNPLSNEAADVTLTEPAVVTTGIDAARGEAPSAFESPMEVTPMGTPGVSAMETVASVPLAMILEFTPSAMQL